MCLIFEFFVEEFKNQTLRQKSMLLIFICNSKDVTVGADMRRLIGFF